MRMTDAAADPSSVAHAASRGGGAAATETQAPPTTVWWHQIDDENDDAYEVNNFADWAATKDLRRARLQLMNNKAAEGVAALEKLRSDFLLYARDAG